MANKGEVARWLAWQEEESSRARKARESAQRAFFYRKRRRNKTKAEALLSNAGRLCAGEVAND